MVKNCRYNESNPFSFLGYSFRLAARIYMDHPTDRISHAIVTAVARLLYLCEAALQGQNTCKQSFS